MTITVDRPLFFAICIALLAVMFLVGVWGWCRTAARADELSFADERAHLDALAQVSRARPRRARYWEGAAPVATPSEGTSRRRARLSSK